LIRNTESYAQKWDYVRENPVRAGLVSTGRNGNIKVKLWRLTTREDLPPVTAAATTLEWLHNAG
jgi:hypothetical protein